VGVFGLDFALFGFHVAKAPFEDELRAAIVDRLEVLQLAVGASAA